jgi:UDP-glucose 4-epimerase
VSNACCKALAGLPITLRRDRRFSYVWATDLAAVVERAIADKGSGGLPAGAYNVTPLEPVRLRELADMVADLAGPRARVDVAEEGMGLDYYGEGAKLRDALAEWTPTSIGDCVRRLYGWYAERQDDIDHDLLRMDR